MPTLTSMPAACVPLVSWVALLHVSGQCCIASWAMLSAIIRLCFFAWLERAQHGVDKREAGLQHTSVAVYVLQDLHMVSGRASEAWWQKRESERVSVCLRERCWIVFAPKGWASSAAVCVSLICGVCYAARLSVWGWPCCVELGDQGLRATHLCNFCRVNVYRYLRLPCDVASALTFLAEACPAHMHQTVSIHGRNCLCSCLCPLPLVVLLILHSNTWLGIRLSCRACITITFGACRALNIAFFSMYRHPEQ